jgi:hypothetical protein
MSSFEDDYAPWADSDAHDEMDARFGWGLRNNEVHHLQRDREVLRTAICQTLDANGHLADGEVCTLLALKTALRKVGSPWAGDELHNVEVTGAARLHRAVSSD